MSTIYVITKIGYEYNDEIYIRPEENSGNPVISYTSLIEADANALEMNIQAMLKTEWGEYIYDDLSELLETHQKPLVAEIFRAKNIEDIDRDDIGDLIKSLGPEQMARLSAIMNGPFFMVSEVELV